MSGRDYPLLLTIVVGTYNRLNQLRRCLDSLIGRVQCAHEIIVIDAGSSDGTLQYLESIKEVSLQLDGRRIGQARSYNRAFQRARGELVCWLSDDNIVLPGRLDEVATIMMKYPEIGMTGLKTRDISGPFQNAPYIGGISEVGILNVNQGVVRRELLAAAGFFSEELMGYGIDPDLTARILLMGAAVVYSRKVAILHDRAWADDAGEFNRRRELMLRGQAIYMRDYGYLSKKYPSQIWKRMIPEFPFLPDERLARIPWIGRWIAGWLRDWRNIRRGRFISVMDPIRSFFRPFHLVQKIPQA
ncbi:MAG: glycosyltransferase [Spirochaetales bacterium]|nr:glycosyltransferase [Spirochaetales bacterium]